MSPPTNFFALGRPEPTLTVIHVGFFGVWTAMRAELADYYDEDAELFRIVEASWNADEEYAELVTLNGRIIGALDHALTQDDVAAIWGVISLVARQTSATKSVRQSNASRGSPMPPHKNYSQNFVVIKGV